jgi:single-stranded-DNA-specific exonuclease
MLDAIAFNVDVDFYQANLGQTLRFLYRLDVNEFRGLESLQLIIEYAERPLEHSL